MLSLEPIPLHPDRSNKIYASDDCQNLLKMWEEFYPAIGYHLPWVGYIVIQNDRVVGSCAFTGQPKNNRVEISYWTFKENEGKGISTWACKELVSIAKKQDPNLVVTAKTAPEKNASTTILERNGFVFAGVVQDHEIGDAWEWIYEK
ncbi:MAG: GNAT family N-acetyltransferase [Bacteroidia bacterium]|nr:GNAT family N-acetyltransferase [Bacteroidia bacterium]